MRRVVVTGMGIVSPLGVGVSHTSEALMAGKSGLVLNDRFDLTGCTSHVAGLIPKGKRADGCFDPHEFVDIKEARRMDPFTIYGLAATAEAVENAGLHDVTDEKLKERIGVLLGSGIGGEEVLYHNSVLVGAGEYKKVSPFFIPSLLINILTGHVSIRYGFKGPNSSVVTACATGTHAIGDSWRIIRNDEADIMICGSAEAPISPVTVVGFGRMHALSTAFNDRPIASSRPWDQDRDGFVMAEAAATLVLEEYEHAKKRGATIYAEIVGYGMSGDAYHITAPAEDGDGAYRCVQAALRSAALPVDSIQYVNAHGTSTPMGDAIELKAMHRLFGSHAKNVYMSSTKGATGHALGAAGSIEAIFAIEAMRHGIVPPTLNLENPLESTIDLVPLKAKEASLQYALSNSFGFGGTNASLIFKKFV